MRSSVPAMARLIRNHAGRHEQHIHAHCRCQNLPFSQRLSKLTCPAQDRSINFRRRLCLWYDQEQVSKRSRPAKPYTAAMRAAREGCCTWAACANSRASAAPSEWPARHNNRFAAGKQGSRSAAVHHSGHLSSLHVERTVVSTLCE